MEVAVCNLHHRFGHLPFISATAGRDQFEFRSLLAALDGNQQQRCVVHGAGIGRYGKQGFGA